MKIEASLKYYSSFMLMTTAIENFEDLWKAGCYAKPIEEKLLQYLPRTSDVNRKAFESLMVIFEGQLIVL